MTSSDWATQQLAELLAVLTSAADEDAAIVCALERLAESFDAEAGAFVRNDQLCASLGWAAGSDNSAELAAVVAGERDAVHLPGAGRCETVVVPLQGDDRSAFVLARAGHRFTAEEVGLLRGMARVLELGLRQLSAVAAERRHAEQNAELVSSLRHQAMHDDLTGLPNRACFYDRTDRALELAAQDGSYSAVLLFDLNRFKEINDTLGHRYGDRVLREIGPRLRRGLRDADTLARLGGDEFGVLLPGVAGAEMAVQVAERLLGLLDMPFEIDGMAMPVEASCGVVIAPLDGDSADLLLQRADVAMYVAKNARAGVIAYDDELNVNTRARLALLGELRTAIAQDQLVLFYQPKASLAGGGIEGVEALVRWQHPKLGMLPPNDFVPLAELTGLIKPLTSWVLESALHQLSLWRSGEAVAFSESLSVAVNVSARSLLDDDFPAEVAGALARWGIPARLLELEITESTIMADPARAHRLLSQLAAAGVKVAIDDFGTGYSSLSYLKQLPVSELKIDRSFVMHMNQEHNDAVIVRSVIDLGHNLGLHTVAEGIEDSQTWEHLKSLGCDSGQGFLLARPMPADLFVAWLATNATVPHVSLGASATPVPSS